MAKGKGAAPAAAPVVATAPAAPQFSTAPGPIPTVAAPAPTLGGKTEAQVKTETDALIAESLQEIADDPNPWGNFEATVAAEEAAAAGKGKGKDGKGKTGKGKDKKAPEPEPEAEEPEADEEEADEEEAEADADADEEADEEEADGETEEETEEERDGKAYAGKRKALKKLEKRVNEQATTNEQNAQWIEKEFGNSYRARLAVKNGDRESARKYIEADLAAKTGMTLEEAIVFLVDPSKAPSEADLRVRKLEKERADERAAAATAEANSQKVKAENDLKVWIETDLGADPKTKRLLKIPGFVQNCSMLVVQKYHEGITTPKKAAKAVTANLLGMRKALNEAFADVEEEAPAPAQRGNGRRPPKNGRGSPPRGNAAGNATENARPMTTGDAIAETMIEMGLMKSTDARNVSLRGKKIGVA